MCAAVVTIKDKSTVVSAWHSLKALVYIHFRNESSTDQDSHSIQSVSNCQSSLWNLVLKQLLGVTKVKHTWGVSPIAQRFIDKYKQFHLFDTQTSFLAASVFPTKGEGRYHEIGGTAIIPCTFLTPCLFQSHLAFQYCSLGCMQAAALPCFCLLWSFVLCM